jgi:tRNA(fMet)-specific endonuclease VapC
MRRLLDTNAYVALKHGDRDVEELVREAEHLHFSIIVLGELYFGFHHGTRLRQNVAELDLFLSHPYVSIAFLLRTTADRFGRLARHLKRVGTPIPTNDIWLAAQCLELGAELVSFDRHFDKVPGLVFVDPRS